MASHAFSALCVYWTFRHHPHPWATFVPKFISFVTSIAELASGKICVLTQSLTYSPSLFDALETEAFALENIYNSAIIRYAN